MAIELTEDLIMLERSAWAEQQTALSGPYSTEAWQPWRDATEAVQAAVTAHAAATGQPRCDVEAELKRRVRHTEAEDA